MKERLLNLVLRLAKKLQTQRHMVSIRNAFSTMLPIIIAGAFCTLILNVVVSTTSTGISLAKLPGMAWLSHFAPMFNAANYATMNFFAIGIVFLIAMDLARGYGIKDNVVSMVAIASFVSLCSTSATLVVDGELHTIFNVLPRQFTNAQGLFMGMFAAIASTEIYCRMVKSKKLEITMPSSVPSNVAQPFNVMFPAILTILIVSGFGMVFEMASGRTVYDAINVFIQAPLKGILTGLPGYLVLFVLATLLWSIGINGTMVLRPIYESTMLGALAANLDAVTAGLPAPNILNTTFTTVFTSGTGAGMTGGLVVALLLFSKRDDYKTIAKLSLVPGFFNINETMTFGLPIVMNPILIIPFVLAPIVSATFGYFMTLIGFATPMVYLVPWTTPPLIKSWLATGGHIGTVVTELLAYGLVFLVYLPFVFITNRQVASEETNDAFVAAVQS